MVLPAFKNDSTNPRSFAGVILTLTLLILSYIVVGCRFWSRYKVRIIGLDDWFILPVLVCFSLYLAATIEAHVLVPGDWPDTIDKAVKSTITLIILEVSYCYAILFLKISLGFFFLRLVVSKRQRQLIKVLMVTSTLTNFGISFWDIGVCGNPSKFYYNVFNGKCVKTLTEEAIAYFQASINMITDLVLLCLPFFLLKGSQMPRRVKTYVIGILVLAMAGFVASIVRFFYIHTLFDIYGFFTGSSALAIVTTMEMASGIIASSLATLRPLLSTFAPPGTIDELPNRGRGLRRSTFSFSRPWHGGPRPRHRHRQTPEKVTDADTDINTGVRSEFGTESGSSRTRHPDYQVEEILSKDVERAFVGFDTSAEKHFGLVDQGNDGLTVGLDNQRAINRHNGTDNKNTTVRLVSGHGTLASGATARRSWRQSLKHSLRTSWNPIHGTWFDFRNSDFADSEAGEKQHSTQNSSHRQHRSEPQDEHTYMFHPADLDVDNRHSDHTLPTHILPSINTQQPRRIDSKARLLSPANISVIDPIIPCPKPAFLTIKPTAVPPKQSPVLISTSIPQKPKKSEKRDVNNAL